MNRRLFPIALGLGLLCAAAAIGPFASPSQAASCKWGTIGVGCNADTFVVLFSHPATNCPGSTVDLQKRETCGFGGWTTIATNVTSPLPIYPATDNTEYRLVATCSCGGTYVSQSTGCFTCP